MTKPGCQQYPDCECTRDFYCIEGERKRGCWPLVAMAIVAWIGIAWLFMWSTGAHAHDAMPTAAQPEGWKYPFSCCSGYDCRRVGDGQPIPKSEGGDGVFITETTKGFVISSSHEVVAHDDPRIKESPDGLYHWCSVAGDVVGRTICLYVPPRSF
jgi:hypothetical protein